MCNLKFSYVSDILFYRRLYFVLYIRHIPFSSVTIVIIYLLLPCLQRVFQLLQLLIHLQERGESDDAQKILQEEEQENLSGGVVTAGTDTAPVWGSPPSRKQAVTLNEDSCAEECRRKRCDAPLSRAGSSGSSSSSIRSSSSSSSAVGAADQLDDTPRKLRRLQALRNARFNQTGNFLLGELLRAYHHQSNP